MRKFRFKMKNAAGKGQFNLPMSEWRKRRVWVRPPLAGGNGMKTRGRERMETVFEEEQLSNRSHRSHGYNMAPMTKARLKKHLG